MNSKRIEHDLGRRVLHLSHDFICALTFEAELRYVNPAMAAALAVPAEELAATSFLSLVHGEDRMQTKRKLQECVKGVSPDRFENRLLRRDGSFIWVQWCWDAEQEKSELLGVGRDVTEQINCTDELRTAYRNLDLILNSIDDGVHGLDAEGRTVFLNPAARRLHGWALAELANQHAHDKIHGTKSDGSAFAVKDCPIQATMRDGVQRRVSDDIFWRKDGSSFPVAYTAAAQRNEKGQIAGGLVIFRDLSQQKAAG